MDPVTVAINLLKNSNVVDMSGTLSAQSIDRAKKLIIEGILILTNKTLRESINYSVFLDCPRDIRFERRLERDIKERGRNYNDVVNLFKNRLDKMHNKYVEPFKKKSDLILNTNKTSTKRTISINLDEVTTLPNKDEDLDRSEKSETQFSEKKFSQSDLEASWKNYATKNRNSN